MKASDWDLSKAIGHKSTPYEVAVTKKDLMLYSLGIGFQADPLNASHYNFTYENAEDFQSFPTMPVVLAHRNMEAAMSLPGVPQYNPMMLLHGEETVEVFKPLEADTTVVVQDTLVDLQDKGKATVLVNESTLTDKETGEVLSKILTSTFVRGIGGFGERGKIR